MTTEVCLVDGVGRPRLAALRATADEIAAGGPETLDVAHDRRGVGIVKFDRSGEADPDGRPVYRMRGSGRPPIRFPSLNPGA